MRANINLFARLKITLSLLLLAFMLLVSACAPLTMTEEPLPTTTPSRPQSTITPPQPIPSATPTKAPVGTSTSISNVLADAARLALARLLGMDFSKIKVVSFEATIWPDSCLGVTRIGVVCSQAITSGYRIGLQAGGQAYEYHTNLSGGSMLLASPSDVAANLPVITYHREGGIAGFCDDISIFANGKAKFSSCKSSKTTEISLSETQMASLYQWLDKFEGFDYERNDPPVTDRMSISLKLIGNGLNPASDADIQAILNFMSQIAVQNRQ